MLYPYLPFGYFQCIQKRGLVHGSNTVLMFYTFWNVGDNFVRIMCTVLRLSLILYMCIVVYCCVDIEHKVQKYFRLLFSPLQYMGMNAILVFFWPTPLSH